MMWVQERVQHGVQPELLQLARIKGVGGFRARQLYDAGLRQVADVAEAEPTMLTAVLAKSESHNISLETANLPLSNEQDALLIRCVSELRDCILTNPKGWLHLCMLPLLP